MNQDYYVFDFILLLLLLDKREIMYKNGFIGLICICIFMYFFKVFKYYNNI